MKKHPTLMAIDRYVVACLTATCCIVSIQSCMPTKKQVKPVVISESDSLRKLRLETDLQADKDRFRENIEAKAKGMRKHD